MTRLWRWLADKVIPPLVLHRCSGDWYDSWPGVRSRCGYCKYDAGRWRVYPGEWPI